MDEFTVGDWVAVRLEPGSRFITGQVEQRLDDGWVIADAERRLYVEPTQHVVRDTELLDVRVSTAGLAYFDDGGIDERHSLYDLAWTVREWQEQYPPPPPPPAPAPSPAPEPEPESEPESDEVDDWYDHDYDDEEDPLDTDWRPPVPRTQAVYFLRVYSTRSTLPQDAFIRRVCWTRKSVMRHALYWQAQKDVRVVTVDVARPVWRRHRLLRPPAPEVAPEVVAKDVK